MFSICPLTYLLPIHVGTYSYFQIYIYLLENIYTVLVGQVQKFFLVPSPYFSVFFTSQLHHVLDNLLCLISIMLFSYYCKCITISVIWVYNNCASCCLDRSCLPSTTAYNKAYLFFWNFNSKFSDLFI